MHVTKNLIPSLILMALSVNNAMAFNGIGTAVDSFCSAEQRIPLTPFDGDCTVCHDNGSSGGSGAGRTASKNNNMDFFCQLQTMNVPPVADAGPAQSVIHGDTVTLNGTGSTDADGDSLIYNWAFSSKPTGSTALLSSLTASNPTFVVDLAGSYEVTLFVNDGTANSGTDTVIITAGVGNTAPVANAGPNQAAKPGDIVTLDGSGSTDIDGDFLNYAWTFTSKPTVSQASLSGATTAMPTFTADIAGNYVLELVVNDGMDNSSAVSVSIIVKDAPKVNVAPVADAGTPQAVITNIDIVKLDGSGSTDADGDTLTYSWTFSSLPTGSFAFLSASTTINPSFIADEDGDYVVQLIVNDGQVDSQPKTVKITATTENIPPVNIAPIAKAGNDQNTQTGNTVLLDGTGSSDANGDTLSYSWSLLSMPDSSMATLSDPVSETPSFVADKAGDYVIQLIVNDDQANSEPSTVMIKVNDQPVVKPAIKQNLSVSPAKLILEKKYLGRKLVRIKLKLKNKSWKRRSSSNISVPVLVDIFLTKPDGSVETLKQKHFSLKRVSKIRAKFRPKMEGQYLINTIVRDEAGNELSSKTKSVSVKVKHDDDDDDDDDDHHKRGKKHHD